LYGCRPPRDLKNVRRPVVRAYHLAAVALATSLGGSLARAAPPAVQDVDTYRLDNGLTLHVASGHPSPVVAVQAWVGVGSADEAPAEAGLAHVLEHMMFKGSSEYAVGELTRAIEASGGEINAWTSFDQTVYHAVLGADHAEGAIDAIGDTLTAPRVDPDELDRERRVILEEIRQGSDDPARGVAQRLFATAYVHHPYRRPVIGTAETVARFGERALIDFFRTHYVADNVTVVVAGDVDPARIRQRVERRFRAMPSGRTPRRRTAEPAQTAPRTGATDRSLSEAYLAVGFHVPSARHPDLAALDVASILLGQSESARLPRLLGDRDAVVTSAYAHVHALRDPGLFVLSATAQVGKARRALTGLVEQGTALADTVTEDELEKARLAVEAGFVRQLETAQGRARALGWYGSVAGDPHFGHVYLDRVRGLRRHDLAGAVRRYLRPDNASVAAILPASARARAPRHVAFARDAERHLRRGLARAPVAAADPERRVVLPNGMVVLLRRDPSVPVVAMRAVWRGGLRAEDARTVGTSAMLARLLTRGCAGRDAVAVADRIDRLGGALGASAGKNSLAVSAEWLTRTWEPGLDLLADCVLTPTFAADEIERERRLLLEDLAAQGDNPSQVAFRLFLETLYPSHPYRLDVLGTAASIGAQTRAQLVRAYRERYPVSALTLAIVGDIDVDAALAQVTARFAAVPARPATTPTVVAPRFDGRPASEREVYRYLERAQAHLVVGFPGATVDAPDRFALELLVAILGGQGGRLFAALREQQALVYRVSAHSVEGVDPGFVAVYLSCAPDKLELALAGVRAELDRVVAGGVTAEELARAQQFLIGSHEIALQRRAAVASAMAYHEAYGLGWQGWAGYAATIRAVRVEDVAAAAASYLRWDRAVTATVRPPAMTPGAEQRSKIRQPVRALPPRRAPVHPRRNA
jgi:zinc protease